MSIREACAKIADEHASPAHKKLEWCRAWAAAAEEIGRDIRALPLPEATEEEREELAREICRAEGRDPDYILELPSASVVRSEGDKPVSVATTVRMPMWKKHAATAAILLKAGWRRA